MGDFEKRSPDKNSSTWSRQGLDREGTKGGWTIALCVVVVVATWYVSMIGQWPLDKDEFYSLEHTRKPVLEIAKKTFPFYFILTHFTIKLPVSDAVGLRLPTALFGSLAAGAMYLGCRRLFGAGVAACTVILLIPCPWMFHFSQEGRYYATGFFLSAISQLGLFGYVLRQRQVGIVLYVVSGVLAVWTHTSAVIPFVASGFAALVAGTTKPRAAIGAIRARWKWVVPGVVLALVLVGWFAHTITTILSVWLSTSYNKFGDYSFPSLMTALAVNVGLHVWALALIPMARPWRLWSPAERFFVLTVLVAIAPFVVLAPFGGGVAPRYLAFAMPSLFALAGIHLEAVAKSLPTVSLRVAVVLACLAFNVPYLASTFADGDHYDYRSAVAFVDSLEPMPIVASTSHGVFEYYAKRDYGEVHELGFLRHLKLKDGKVVENHVGRTVTRMIELARERSQPVVLLAREDRLNFPEETAQWLYRHFAVVHVVERARYDHRRKRLVVYEYRPQVR